MGRRNEAHIRALNPPLRASGSTPTRARIIVDPEMDNQHLDPPAPPYFVLDGCTPRSALIHEGAHAVVGLHIGLNLVFIRLAPDSRRCPLWSHLDDPTRAKVAVMAYSGRLAEQLDEKAKLESSGPFYLDRVFPA